VEQPEVAYAGPLTLRRADPAWAQPFDEAIRESLPELSQFMPWATPDHGLPQSTEFLLQSVVEWDRGENWNYVLFGPGDQVAGSVGLMTRLGPQVLELGYWIRTSLTGRGYASAAANAAAELALASTGVDRAAIRYDAANARSARVAAKCGFTEVARDAYEPLTASQSGVLVTCERRRAPAAS
jgi:ribosomal-protein-serine acetyltransferase